METNRWKAFTREELATINQALIDSGSTHSDYAWYLRCAKLQAELTHSLSEDREGDEEHGR